MHPDTFTKRGWQELKATLLEFAVGFAVASVAVFIAHLFGWV
jgi:hypothetical protein